MNEAEDIFRWQQKISIQNHHQGSPMVLLPGTHHQSEVRLACPIGPLLPHTKKRISTVPPLLSKWRTYQFHRTRYITRRKYRRSVLTNLDPFSPHFTPTNLYRFTYSQIRHRSADTTCTDSP